MIAVATHLDASVRAEIAAVLDEAGWTVHEAAGADAALAACRESEADVLLIAQELCAGSDGVLERVKRDSELYRTAVVIVGAGITAPEVVEWLQRGADDVLLTPLDPADVIGRAFAASRTKALVKELTAQNDRLEELVFFDELTGLRNRRAVLHELEMLLAGSRRHGHELSVLMLDVDRFKQINDQYGHRAGDEVLREVSRRVAGRLRTADVAGRLGGDELLVALPDTGAEGAAVLAESIRNGVGDGPVHTLVGEIPVTVSIGSAAWSTEDLGQLLERADAALYAAKAAGRDRSATG